MICRRAYPAGNVSVEDWQGFSLFLKPTCPESPGSGATRAIPAISGRLSQIQMNIALRQNAFTTIFSYFAVSPAN